MKIHLLVKMKKDKLQNMKKGWFVGNFSPTVLRTNDVEVAVKTYKKGSSEERHFHKVATEVTVIISGLVVMNGVEYGEGDVITVAPCESTDFLAVDDTVTVVVKHPGQTNDKYIGDFE